MASTTSTKTPCAMCGVKGVGVFKCEGCSETFCRKHANEHRDILSNQLDEISIGHDLLQQSISSFNDEEECYRSVIQQINKWEEDSIKRIQQIAVETRNQVEKLISLRKEKITKELHELTEKMQKARIDDDYVEKDLCNWTMSLEKLKEDVTTISSSIHIREDWTQTFLGKIYISEVNSSDVKKYEYFGQSFGNIHIQDNGFTAMHIGPVRSDAFIRGTYEYSTGKYKIHFTVKKKTTEYYFFFGVISKMTSIPHDERDMRKSTYGWRSNGRAITPHVGSQALEDVKDMKSLTTLELELVVDCNNRKIMYINEKAKTMREMNVDTGLCPFPWQTLFYLYDVGDSIQFVSLTEEP